MNKFIVYDAYHDLLATLAANQRALLYKPITPPAPFEEPTRQIGSFSSSTAEVIYLVTVLKQPLTQQNQQGTGIRPCRPTL